MRAKSQGIGRQTQENVGIIGQDDLRAMSLYLGNKAFMMGDTPTTVSTSLLLIENISNIDSSMGSV